ncbi:hypothetical protein MBLNU457_2026t1 [Dothideomycetes sp. NU457]
MSAPLPTPTAGGSIFDTGAGAAQFASGQSAKALFAAIVTAVASAGVQVAIFYILRLRLTRIYEPKTYLVAERFRVPSPPKGAFNWLVPVFTIPNSVVIEKCGLDAYFFLRYLRMLLKLFVPMTVLILPILLPINKYSAGPTTDSSGVDQLGWSHIGTNHQSRRWAALVLAILTIIWFCYIVFDELRGYIRIRQAHLSSPQHRIRASATTVLVSAIPRKWLTIEALNGLYDVFPGGIRNIWINRNFDELNEKVELRNKYAKQLEGAETALIRKCWKKHQEAEKKKAKQEGRKKQTKAEKEKDSNRANDEAEQMARGEGLSAGAIEGGPHDAHQLAHDINHPEERRSHEDLRDERNRFKNPLSLVGQGFTTFGHFGKNLLGDITEDVTKAYRDVNHVVDGANKGAGFDDSSSLFDTPRPAHDVSDSTTITNLAATPATPGPSAAQHEESQPEVHDFAKPDNEQDTSAGAKRSPPRQSRHSASSSRLTGLRQLEDVDVLDNPRTSAAFHPSEHISSDDVTSSVHNGQSFDKLRPKSAGNDATATAKHQSAIKAGITSTVDKVVAYTKRPAIPFPSPQPHATEGDSYPLDDLGAHPADPAHQPNQRIARSKWLEGLSKTMFWKKDKDADMETFETEYAKAFNEDIANEEDGAVWTKYIESKDRDTRRIPVKPWMPALPFIGKKEDKILFLRRELARLNVEIEEDQNDIEKYPFMNSAFIQFNHQIAAHMACQSVSHHVPQHMAPRLVEISPGDIIWNNMSIMWWERYLRTGVVVALCAGLIVLFAIPVGFTGIISQLNYLAPTTSWLHWFLRIPDWFRSFITGSVPPLLLSLLLTLVPILFRLLVGYEGVPTGNDKELGVQLYYFFFLFVQVFLVATLSTGLIAFFTTLASNPATAVTTLARSLPKAANYFFSYLIIQALSNSASSLLQIFTLLFAFILGPMFDSTPRAKWRRQTNPQTIQWGSFFPPYTNFACIGIIFSVISPLIMVFNIISFSVYWFVSRYNILYVYNNVRDTGGLLFPVAVNQLFVGIYVMELALIGLFFIAQNADGSQACIPQGAIMIAALVLTIVFHVSLNSAFSPLFRYLPITLEDEAVIRDEEFAKAQNAKFRGLTAEEPAEGQDIEDQLEARERREAEAEREAEEAERQRVRTHRKSSQNLNHHHHNGAQEIQETKPAAGAWKQDRWKAATAATRLPTTAVRRLKSVAHRGDDRRRSEHGFTATKAHEADSESDDDAHAGALNERSQHDTVTHVNSSKPVADRSMNPQGAAHDTEAQRAIGDVLFGGYSDELEDLTPEERDTLVRYSFQHIALRARRPVVWIPRDPLGVSDDEIRRTKAMSTVTVGDGEHELEKGLPEKKTNIWISNEGSAMNAAGKVVFRKSPPDFDHVDLISL